MNDIVIDPKTSKWRADLRCTSPFCTHQGPIVQLHGLILDKFWCTECGRVDTLASFVNRTGPLKQNWAVST